MTDRFVCSEDNIYIALGPAIRWCCYHVDLDVMNAVSRATGPGDYFIKKGWQVLFGSPSSQ